METFLQLHDVTCCQDHEDERIQSVFSHAAMKDKTVILTTLSEAWAVPGSVFELFLESFRKGVDTRKLLDHLVVIALDSNAFARCLSIHVHCLPLVTEGIDFSGGEKFFMSHDYLKMMWRRIDFLRSVLVMGYNFVFTVCLALFFCYFPCMFLSINLFMDLLQ